MFGCFISNRFMLCRRHASRHDTDRLWTLRGFNQMRILCYQLAPDTFVTIALFSSHREYVACLTNVAAQWAQSRWSEYLRIFCSFQIRNPEQWFCCSPVVFKTPGCYHWNSNALIIEDLVCLLFLLQGSFDFTSISFHALRIKHANDVLHSPQLSTTRAQVAILTSPIRLRSAVDLEAWFA